MEGGDGLVERSNTGEEEFLRKREVKARRGGEYMRSRKDWLESSGSNE